jgi:hypothetical protein
MIVWRALHRPPHNFFVFFKRMNPTKGVTNKDWRVARSNLFCSRGRHFNYCLQQCLLSLVRAFKL